MIGSFVISTHPIAAGRGGTVPAYPSGPGSDDTGAEPTYATGGPGPSSSGDTNGARLLGSDRSSGPPLPLHRADWSALSLATTAFFSRSSKWK